MDVVDYDIVRMAAVTEHEDHVVLDNETPAVIRVVGDSLVL